MRPQGRSRAGGRRRRPPAGRWPLLRQTVDRAEPPYEIDGVNADDLPARKQIAQDAEGIKAMADIAAADVAIRKRTADLRALRLAKEAADRDKPAEPKARLKKKKTT